MMTQPCQGTTLFDPGSESFQQDPYSVYRRLRETDPIHRHRENGLVLTRYHDCLTVLEDLRFKTLENIRCHSDESVRGKPEGPEAVYVLFRKAVTKSLTPAKVRARQEMIQRLTDDLIDRMMDAGKADLMESFCYALAMAVFCEIYGIPAADRALFRDWMEPIVEGLDDAPVGVPAAVAERRDQARAELAAYLQGLAADRRKRPADDLLTEFVQIEHEGQRLSDREVAEASIIVLLAGHETSASFVGNGIFHLLRNPAELRQVRADPALWPTAAEELLRYEPPAQVLIRQASMDFELSGRRIPEGDILVVSLAGANRDPEVFREPERLDVRRDPNPHISFGFGPHYCLGTSLARAEGIIAMRTLFERAPGIALLEQPKYRATLIRRALRSLWVELS